MNKDICNRHIYQYAFKYNADMRVQHLPALLYTQVCVPTTTNVGLPHTYMCMHKYAYRHGGACIYKRVHLRTYVHVHTVAYLTCAYSNVKKEILNYHYSRQHIAYAQAPTTKQTLYVGVRVPRKHAMPNLRARDLLRATETSTCISIRPDA